MNNNRPVNLDFSTIQFPIPAIVSILHRISGCVLLVGILILIWMLDMSLTSKESFDYLRELMQMLHAKLILWAVLAATAYHLVAGLRHLLMDLGFGETLRGGKITGTVSIVLSAVLIILAGVWVW